MQLAEFTKHVDRLIKRFEPGLERILDGMTAEGPNVAALFDCSDREAMLVYHELGLQPAGAPGTCLVVDVLHQPLLAALEEHQYVPIDELPAYEAGTVLAYVFTCDAVAVRRFKAFAGVRRGLREVRRVRTVQFEPTGLRLEGRAALDLIVQRCGEVLRSLWDRSTERVALIQGVSYGARVGYVDRSVTMKTLRDGESLRPTGGRSSGRVHRCLPRAEAGARRLREVPEQAGLVAWFHVPRRALGSLASPLARQRRHLGEDPHRRRRAPRGRSHPSHRTPAAGPWRTLAGYDGAKTGRRRECVRRLGLSSPSEDLEFLYRAVPRAARADAQVYECLALVDAVRGGRARERELAVAELRKRLS